MFFKQIQFPIGIRSDTFSPFQHTEDVKISSDTVFRVAEMAVSIRDSKPPVTDYQSIDKSLVNLIKNQWVHSACGVSPYRSLNPIHHHTYTHTLPPLDNHH